MRSEKDLKQDLRTLGLEPGASLDDVERAYRELSATWDPDRMPDVAGLKESARKKLRELRSAADSIRAWHARAEGKGIEGSPTASSLFEEIFARGGRKRNRWTYWLTGLAGAALVVALVLVLSAPTDTRPAPTDPVPQQAETQEATPDFEPGQSLKAIKVVTPPETPAQAETARATPKPEPTKPSAPQRPKPRLVRPPEDRKPPL